MAAFKSVEDFFDINSASVEIVDAVEFVEVFETSELPLDEAVNSLGTVDELLAELGLPSAAAPPSPGLLHQVDTISPQGAANLRLDMLRRTQQFLDRCQVPGCAHVSVCRPRYVFLGRRREVAVFGGGVARTYVDCGMVKHLYEDHEVAADCRCPIPHKVSAKEPNGIRTHGSKDLLRQHLPSHVHMADEHPHYLCLLCATEGGPQKGSKTRDNAVQHFKTAHRGLWLEWKAGRVPAVFQGLVV